MAAALWGEGQDACSERVVCTGVYRCVQVCGGQVESENKELGELLLENKISNCETEKRRKKRPLALNLNWTYYHTRF